MIKNFLLGAAALGLLVFGRSSAMANDPPVAIDQSVTVAFGGTLPITLTATDPDGDALSFSILSSPANGSLSGSAPTVTYTPNGDFNGHDAFTFRVDDGAGHSADGIISIHVGPPGATTVYGVDSGSLTSHGAYGANLVSLAGVPEGRHLFTMRGTSADGQTAFASIHFTIDNTPPTLVWIAHPGFPSTVIPVKGTINMKVRTSDNRESPPSDDGIGFVRLYPPQGAPKNFIRTATFAEWAHLNFDTRVMPDGLSTFGAAAADRAGNVSAPTITYQTLIDNALPTGVNVTITPAPVVVSGEHVIRGLVQISGTATDATSGVKHLKLFIKSGATDQLLGTYPGNTFSNAALNTNGYGDGAWLVRVEAFDQVDNMASHAHAVSIDNTSPAITITLPAHGATGLAGVTELRVTATDLHEIGVRKIYAKKNSDALTERAMTFVSPDRWILDTPLTEPGVWTIRAYAEDRPGNAAYTDIAVTVAGTNQAPVAVSQPVSAVEDTPRAITLGASDADGDALSFVIVAAPTHGALSGTGASRTYTPASNYNGADSFTFKANDGASDSNLATVSITVAPVNDRPVVTNIAFALNEDVATGVTLTGSDVEGSVLTFSIVTPPTKGALSGTMPNLTYTPSANINGADSLVVKANDGTTDSDPLTIPVTIAPVNDAPTAHSQSLSTQENVARPITFSGTDIESDPLVFIVAVPVNGAITGDGVTRTFTPAPGFTGTVSFTFMANDGLANSAPATVNVSVTPAGGGVNNPPTAQPGSFSPAEDQPTPIPFSATDLDNDPLTFIVLSAPSHGTLSGSGGSRLYTSHANHNGADSFSFKVNDGIDDSAPALITLNVTPVNDAPVALAGSATTPRNTARALVLPATDVDGDTLTYAIVSGPAHGVLSGSGAAMTYTPSAGYMGADSFTFRANDGTVNSNVATFTLNVLGGNTPPVTTDGAASTNEDQPVAFTLSGSDVDGDALTYMVVTPPSHGVVTGTPPSSLSYTPTANYHGIDSLTFKANDGTADSNFSTINVTIVSVNDAPAVALTAPANGAFVRGTVAVTMLATDDTAVTQTRVRVDSGAEQAAPGTGGDLYTYSWNSNAAAEGAHTLEALARDASSAQGAQTVTVTVDRTPPAINTFVPADGADVVGVATVNSSVSDDRSLSFVEILIDGIQMASRNVVGMAQVISYSWDTTTYGPGTHQVTVRARDSAGNVRTQTHDVTVRLLGGSGALPEFDIISPANNAVVSNVITLRGRITAGTGISAVFRIDGGAPISATLASQDFFYDLDTTSLSDGNHVFEYIATNTDGTTSRSITVRVDNTPPLLTITTPASNSTVFLVTPLLAHVSDGANAIDEVLFELNTQRIALRLGNVDPLNTAYAFQLDTESENPDGTRKWPDSPPGVYNYALTITAWDKARNPTTLTRHFRIDNANIPTSPATIEFNPTGFVSGDAGHQVWGKVVGATIDPASLAQQGDRALTVRVRTNSSPTWTILEGGVSLSNNTLSFNRDLPDNCRYRLTLRVMDTANRLIQGSVEGIKAFTPSEGGTVSTADGLLTLTLPPNTLARPIYLELPVLSAVPSFIELADLSFNQLYQGHATVVGPVRVEGYIDMTSSPIYDEPLVGDASVRHTQSVESIPPTLRSRLRQIQEVLLNDTYFWKAVGTSNAPASQNDPQVQSVSGSTHKLGIYRVTMFSAPGSGITEIFNFPNPFSPGEGPTSITYMLGDNADVSMTIYDALGNLVKKFSYAAGAPGGMQGPNTVPWDGRNGQGDIVASGSYITQFFAKSSSGGRSKAIRKIGVIH